MYSVSKTYMIVTPQSAENGDYEDTGFVFEEQQMDLEETLWEIRELGHYENFDPKSTQQSLYGTELDQDLRTGAYTEYALHIEGDEIGMGKLNKILLEGGLR